MLSRPLRIVTYAADQQGCGFHRMIVPANLLRSSGGAKVSPEKVLHNADWHEAVAPDVIVFQRQYEKAQVKLIGEIRRRCPSAFLVYEIDDLLTEIPKRNYHSSFISKSVSDALKEAISYCDRVVVTTSELAKWATEEMGAKEVVIVPNYLPADYARPRAEPVNKKLPRVGWAGGVSHSGDLDILKEAISSVQGVQWVFFGMKPEFELPDNVEFHEFVPIQNYMDKLASLNIDLMLAPLERNRFNECKSDLKLLEAAAIGAAVIATSTGPYKEFEPPVFAWPNTGADWAAEIQRFANTSYSARNSSAKRMQAWLKQHRTYEANLFKRNVAWLPKPEDLWHPTMERHGPRPLFVSSEDGQKAGIKADAFYGSLSEACSEAILANADVLWLRKGTVITQDGVKRLRVSLIEDQFTASVAPLASDGCNAFPRLNQMTAVQGDATSVIHDIFKEIAAGQKGMMPAFSGPALLIRNQALRNFGCPNPMAYFGDEELSLVEWTANTTEGGLRNIQIFDVFAGATQPQQELNEVKMKRLESRGVIKYVKAQASAFDPSLRRNAELIYHGKTWRGIEYNGGGLRGEYASWAALKPNPVPKSDGSLVEVRHYGGNMDGFAKPYVLYCDPDTILQPFTLGLVQDAFEAGAYAVFGDHEEVDENGGITPCFKSGVDLTYLKSFDYFSQICAFPATYPHENYMTAVIALNCKKIVHIPHVLGRVKKNTAESGTAKSQCIKAYNDEYEPGSTSTLNPYIPEAAFVNFHPSAREDVSTAVIVRLSENPENISAFLATLFNNTNDHVTRVIVLRQEFTDVPVNLGQYHDHPCVHVLDYKHKNVAKALNFAASKCREDIIVFMTDELRVILPTWLDGMKAYLEQGDVGAVGARIYNQGGTVVHAGMVVQNGIASAIHAGLPANSSGYFGQAIVSHEASAVSYRCMAVRRELFEGFLFNGRYASDFADYDLCIRLYENGFKQVVDCSAQFVTVENPRLPDFADFSVFGQEHIDFQDPYLNPNLAVVDVRFDYMNLKSHLAKPIDGQERILLINDSVDIGQPSLSLIWAARERKIVFRAVIDGFNLVLAGPTLENAQAFDMRRPSELREALRDLQINHIVMPSIIGAGSPPAVVECIKTLRSLGIPFAYIGAPAHMVCPRLTMQVNGEDCGSGYLKGPEHCQTCVDMHGSPFGLVDVSSWLSVWFDYSQSISKAA